MNDTNKEILEEARKSLKSIEEGNCKIEGNEEETKIFVVIPVVKYIMDKLRINLCNIKIYPSRDISLYKDNKLFIVIEVKSFKQGEFNFFDLFCENTEKEIGKLKWEKSKNEEKIIHINHDGTAQLRGYSVELYTKEKKRNFKPILTNGKYWILFNERFYKNNGEEMKYGGGISKERFKENKNLLFAPICPNLEIIDAISSILWEGKKNDWEIESKCLKKEDLKVKKLIDKLEKKYKDKNIKNKFIPFSKFLDLISAIRIFE